MDTANPQPAHSRRGLWIKRLGAASFLFFIVKGLLWLLVPAAIVAWRAVAQS
ncbi:MAG: hypothetical protein ACF8QF_02725 [Phycisphaerales bacterium]